ncbi:MAG: hypothetical protein QXR09_01790 [Candidatus Aenigmatarchaeota archaeon]
MKGISPQRFYTYLAILIAIGTIIYGYISLPEMVWVIQTSTADKVCPTILNDKLETYIS